jgi:hypothetical protein
LHKERTDYIALLYPVTETGIQWREALSISMDLENIAYKSFAYNSAITAGLDNQRSVKEALEGVKSSGFRTILVTPNYAGIEVPAIAREAVALNLTNGDYLWIWVGAFDSSLLFSPDSMTRELLSGALLL